MDVQNFSALDVRYIRMGEIVIYLLMLAQSSYHLRTLPADKLLRILSNGRSPWIKHITTSTTLLDLLLQL